VRPDVKKRADELFSRLGMSTSTAMNILLMQTLAHRGFAAPVVLPGEENETPAASTRRLLERVRAGTEPLHGPFDSVDEMFSDILPEKSGC